MKMNTGKFVYLIALLLVFSVGTVNAKQKDTSPKAISEADAKSNSDRRSAAEKASA